MTIRYRFQLTHTTMTYISQISELICSQTRTNDRGIFYVFTFPYLNECYQVEVCIYFRVGVPDKVEVVYHRQCHQLNVVKSYFPNKYD